MSTKIDQSLDEIMTNSGTARGGGRGGRRSGRARTARKPTTPAAPVGGIAKTPRGPKNAVKAPTGPAIQRDSKIVVSNLPKDVTENQIKEYFGKTAGPVKRVEISYGPTGVSRGVANILFARTDGAIKAANALNGILIDGKPMKIEVIVDASQAPAVPAAKTLGDRITQPKPHPKSAAASKSTANAARGEAGKGKRGRGGKARTARPAKKTAEELDSEMVDYFVAAAPADAAAAPAVAAVAATSGDAPMEDEIL